MMGRFLAFSRTSFGLVAAAAFLWTVTLSDAPGLHQRLHQTQGPSHECAVTLLSQGNCEHAPCPVITAPLPSLTTAVVLPKFCLVVASLDFSLLEHAPPAIS